MPEPPATSWWQAARWDDVRTLKSHGGDVNRRNGHGQTALHVAAGAGKEHAVKYLLANGADPRLAPPSTGAEIARGMIDVQRLGRKEGVPPDPQNLAIPWLKSHTPSLKSV